MSFFLVVFLACSPRGAGELSLTEDDGEWPGCASTLATVIPGDPDRWYGRSGEPGAVQLCCTGPKCHLRFEGMTRARP